MATDDQAIRLHGRDYAERFARNQSWSRVRRLMPLIRLTPRARVVDVGCGNGMMMPLVAPHVAQYVGVDLSEPQVEGARRALEQAGLSNASFVCGAIEAYCEAHPAAFDVALAMDISEHVADAEWVGILRAVRTSLAPGGRLYLHTPDATFFLEVMKRHDFVVRQFPEHIAVRSHDENLAVLAEAGFRVAETHFLPHYNVLRFLHPLTVIPGIGRRFNARLFIEAVPDTGPA